MGTGHVRHRRDRLPRAGLHLVGNAPARPRGSAPNHADRSLSASCGQERLWRASQWGDESARAYLVCKAFRLAGPLDVDALSSAAADGVRAGRRQLVQHVAEQVPVPSEVVDLSHTADAERECRTLLARQSRQAVDLTTPPPLRVLLVRLAPEEHVVMLVQHHIVTDGWSLAVLYRCASATPRLDRRPADLPDLPVQYGDYAAWQPERLHDGRLAGVLVRPNTTARSDK